MAQNVFDSTVYRSLGHGTSGNPANFFKTIKSQPRPEPSTAIVRAVARRSGSTTMTRTKATIRGISNTTTATRHHWKRLAKDSPNPLCTCASSHIMGFMNDALFTSGVIVLLMNNALRDAVTHDQYWA